MRARVIVEFEDGGRSEFEVEATGRAAEREEAILEHQQRLGRVLLERALSEVAEGARVPTCCGRRMGSRGRRSITVSTMSGPVVLERRRYRCGRCGHEVHAGDGEILCGPHRATMPLAKRVCQLATTEHFTRMPQLLRDQHGVEMGHEEVARIVHDVGGRIDRERRAEAASFRSGPFAERVWPEPEVRPERIQVSCDGIMYCTNRTEPDPLHPGENRMIWEQMRVGCVAWQDSAGRWSKQVIWGREEPEEFGAALFRLACRCGWREAREKLFACDGADWCWSIRERYFPQAAGILDWYHASQHVWDTARTLFPDDKDAAKAWAEEALHRMRHAGGTGLLAWLAPRTSLRRGRPRKALLRLAGYVRPRQDAMNYPLYRDRDWPIGSGMIESTARQLVGLRLKGPGMHWTEAGALAVTALRAADLNGHWHDYWSTLALPKRTTTI